MGEAVVFLGDQAVLFLISALEELASLAIDLARKAEEVDDSQVAAEVAQAARNIAREANELAQNLRDFLNGTDGTLRKYVRTNIQQTQHFVMVPKVQTQGIMFGPTYTKPNTSVEVGARGASQVPSYMFGQTFMAQPGAQRVPSHANMRAGTFMAEPGAQRVPSHANMRAGTFMAEPGAQRVPSHAKNMRAGTFMAEPGAHGVARVSSHANMGAGTYMAETGASEAESMIREVEVAARKLKAKVVNTHTIPARQKGRK
ncbi:hypothetical protein Tco_0103725 [Tanacetum coccineum]